MIIMLCACGVHAMQQTHDRDIENGSALEYQSASHSPAPSYPQLYAAYLPQMIQEGSADDVPNHMVFNPIIQRPPVIVDRAPFARTRVTCVALLASCALGFLIGINVRYGY